MNLHIMYFFSMPIKTIFHSKIHHNGQISGRLWVIVFDESLDNYVSNTNLVVNVSLSNPCAPLQISNRICRLL